MKVKLLKTLGMKLVIGADGSQSWILPVIELTAGAAEAMTLEQLLAVVHGENPIGMLDKFRGKIENRMYGEQKITPDVVEGKKEGETSLDNAV